MEEALAELERVQTQLLQRISKLEHSYLPANSPVSEDPHTDTDSNTDTVARLSSILRSNGVDDFSFKRVPFDYYDWPLEARRDALDAASVHHLCKSIVLVNTHRLLLLCDAATIVTLSCHFCFTGDQPLNSPTSSEAPLPRYLKKHSSLPTCTMYGNAMEVCVRGGSAPEVDCH